MGLRKLLSKSKYDVRSREKLNSLRNGFQSLGLVGLNGEDIGYTLTESIQNYLIYISENIKKVNVSDVREVILLDSYNSATIEGARTTVEAIRNAVQSGAKDKDSKMVLNTISGMNFALNNGVNTHKGLYRLWLKIVDGVCENENVRGDLYRSGQVYIGSPSKIIHTPCDASKIQGFMSKLFEWSYPDKLIEACVKHFYFVYIHPFCDGNGRTARVLFSSSLVKDVSEKFKYISVSQEINEVLDGYYSTILDGETVVDDRLFLTDFIEYMLWCTCSAIQKGMSNGYKLSGCERAVLEKIDGAGMTVNMLCKHLKYSESSIRDSLIKLVDEGILVRYKEHNYYRYFKAKVN